MKNSTKWFFNGLLACISVVFASTIKQFILIGLLSLGLFIVSDIISELEDLKKLNKGEQSK